ncbi:hypothetical protein [Tomitella cavernea]|uniref:Uncharacterized protein n=1 Tax=Tomitella cavernea TaxID=1387982 RepID=A0ABP9CLF8_9ACTN|nr:hypothetical protein [Tomitella cavernea]
MNAPDRFRSDLDYSLAFGELAEVELPVVGHEGPHPVVAALEEELLSTVLGRLRSVGGFANLFVRSAAGVRMVAVVDAACAIPPAGDDLTAPEDSPGADATIGMFLDYVEHHPGGVTISATAVGRGAVARGAHRIEFAGR